MAGGLVPFALTMTPTAPVAQEAATALGRLMASPMTARLFSGGVMGGVEAGQEYLYDQNVDWNKVAISTGFGIVWNRANPLGEKISSMGYRIGERMAGRTPPVKGPFTENATPNPNEATVAQIDAAGLAGPGATEATSDPNSGLQRDPDAQKAADRAASDEAITLGTSVLPPEDMAELRARKANPELFDEYDRLHDDMSALRVQIRDAQNPERRLGEIDGELEEVRLASVAHSALRNIYDEDQAASIRAALRESLPAEDQLAARREALEREREELTSRRNDWIAGKYVETPEIANMRRSLLEMDGQLRDLGRDVAAARNEAAEYHGVEDIEATTVEPEAPPVELEPATEGAAKPPEPAAPEVPPPAVVAKEAPPAVPPVPAQGVTPNTLELSAQRNIVIRETIARLMAAGRPEAEAKNFAEIEWSRVSTRAARLRGALGSPLDVFYKDSPYYRFEEDSTPVPKSVSKKQASEVPTTFEQESKGKFTTANGLNEVIFHPKADASTIIHENGHRFLEEMRRDAALANAPDDVKLDWKRVENWLKVDPQRGLTTSQHERFARAFERYLWEGIAPSDALTSVFARFAKWLRQIYSSMRGKAISDEMRGVMDRLLAEVPKRVRVTPELPALRRSGERHADMAAKAHVTEAAHVADRIQTESAAVLAAQPPEVVRELETRIAEREKTRAGASGKTEARAKQPGQVERPANRPEPVAGGGVGGGAATTERAGGGPPAAEGARPATGSEAGDAATAGIAEQPAARTVEPAATDGQSTGSQSTGGASPSTGSSVVVAEPKPPLPLAETAKPELKGDELDPYAANIKLRNITSMGDLWDLIQDFTEKNNQLRDVRGPIKVSDTFRLAEDLGTNVLNGDVAAFAKMVNDKFDNAARYSAALRYMLRMSAETTKSADIQLKGNPTDAKLLVEAARARAVFDMVTRTVSKVTYESGANLGVGYRKLPGVPALNDIEAVKAYVSDTTGLTLDQLVQSSKFSANLTTTAQQARWIRAHYMHRNFGRAMVEYYINNLISGLATHTTYSIANGLLTMMRIGPETAVAAAIGHVREMAGLPQRQGPHVYGGEVLAQGMAFLPGVRKGLQAAGAALKTGTTTLLPGEEARLMAPFANPQLESALASQAANVPGAPASVARFVRTADTISNAPVSWAELRSDAYGFFQGVFNGIPSAHGIQQAFADPSVPWVSLTWSELGHVPNVAVKGFTALPIGSLVRAPSRFVAAIHSFFRTLNYTVNVAAQAHRTATYEGRTGVDFENRVDYLSKNPDDDMQDNSRRIANDATLMSSGGELVRRLSKVLDWSPNLPLLGETPILKFVDPFIHITSNVIDQALVQRTPLGWASPTLRADLLGANGAVRQDMAQARMVVGTVLAGTFGMLAAQGLLTGSGPNDRNKARVNRVVNPPYSVRIGDTWYNLHRLGPLGMLLGISADAYEVSQEASKEDATKAAAAVLHAFTQNIIDESFVRGPAELLQAIQSPDRYGQQYVQNMIGNFVPWSVGMAQATRAADPYVREARTVLDMVRRKMPFDVGFGQSTDLLPRRTIWGEKMHSQDSLGPPGVTAIWEQKASQDPTEQVLAGIQYGIAPVRRDIMRVKLTDQEYDDYARISGNLLKMNLDRFVPTAYFQNLPRGQQENLLNAQVRNIREAARGEVMKMHPRIIVDAMQQKSQRALGGRL